MIKTAMIYAVFKSAGRPLWKSLGTDDGNHAQESLGAGIKLEAKVAWKQQITNFKSRKGLFT